MMNTQSPQLHEDFHQEVIDNFTHLLEDINLKEDVKILEIPTFNFRLKKDMTAEFLGLYIGLWSMALAHSFPNDYSVILQKYLDFELPKKLHKNELVAQRARIQQYIELIGHDSEADFSPVSHHIMSLLHTKEEDFRSNNLKIALHIRSVYKYLFERLF